MAAGTGGGGPRDWRRILHEKVVVEQRCLATGARRALYLTAMLLAVAGLSVFSATLVGVVDHDGLAGVDGPARHWFLTVRSDALTAVMMAIAVVFGPVVMPLIVLVFTVAWGVRARHAWRPLLLAGAMMVGVGLAQVIARSVQRRRPPVDQMMLGADHTFSFPSGHVLGAADFLLVTTFLLVSRGRWRRAAAPGFAAASLGVLLVAVSRVYLGYHWITDAVASVSLSLVVLAAVIALDTWRTARSPGRRAGPVGGGPAQGVRCILWIAACARGLTTSWSMFTWCGRESVHAMHSATSSAESGPGTPA